MTHDERQEIEDYILILKKNAEWMVRSISNLQEAVKRMSNGSVGEGEKDDDA